MRNLLITLLVAVCSGCQPGQTLLKGRIENYHGEVVRICPEGLAERRDTLRVDSLGNFTFSPVNGAWGIYEISVKDHQPWVPVYVGEGARTEVVLALQPDKRIRASFAGDRLAENEYLQAYNELSNGRMWYDSELAALPFKDFQARVDKMDKELTEKLNGVKEPALREAFAVKQHLMFRGRLLSYNWLHSRGQQEKQPDADYDAYVQSIDVNDPKECNDGILGDVIGWNLSKKMEGENRNYSDWDVAYLDILDRLVSNREIKDRHATKKIMDKFRFFSGNTFDSVIERFNSLCLNDSLRRQVNAEYAEYVRAYGNLVPGKVAPDFEMTDAQGKKCRLSDLRGKYLFIDIWATWCAPCREEIPHMARVYKHFAGDKRIELISISVDNNRNTWKKFLEKDKPAWRQFNVDKKTNEFLDKEYRIYGIPHFMLIDPQGRFIAYSFTRPSDPGCIKLIENNMNR